jgi:hypothetical protein
VDPLAERGPVPEFALLTVSGPVLGPNVSHRCVKASKNISVPYAVAVRVAEAILEITCGHPYYTTRLSNQLWESDAIPDVEGVQATWAAHVEVEHGAIAAVLAGISPNQLGVLTQVAREPTPAPSGRKFLGRVRLAGSSARQAVQGLVARNLLYRDSDDVYRVYDPAVAWYLRERTPAGP